MTWVISQSSVGTSLAVQWLGLCASTAGGTGSIPGQGTKIAHSAWRGQKKKRKKKKSNLCNGTPIKMMNSDVWVSLTGGNAPCILPHVDSGRVMHPDSMGSRPRKLTFRTLLDSKFYESFL